MTREIDLYQIDSFTNETFGGNPAAVCPLDEWLPDDLLQNIAMENNLSETVFCVAQDDGSYHLRWFTPTVEVDLCGHATLAAAYVIFEYLNHSGDQIIFTGLSGELRVYKTGDGLKMDFPVWPHKKIDISSQISDALGHEPTELYEGYDWVAVYDDMKTVKNMAPDMEKLTACENMRGIIVTAAGNDGVDFVSRFFGPRVGIPEDPVTGSAHCILAPIWAEKLNKTKFNAKQISARGGDLVCELINDRVEISGQAKLFMKGKIYV